MPGCCGHLDVWTSWKVTTTSVKWASWVWLGGQVLRAPNSVVLQPGWPLFMTACRSLLHNRFVSYWNRLFVLLHNYRHHTALEIKSAMKWDLWMPGHAYIFRESTKHCQISHLICSRQCPSPLVSPQVRWCGQVFEGSDPNLLLSRLVASTLSSLDPPMDQVISAAIKQQEEPLLFLVTVKSVGDQFLKDLEGTLGSAKTGLRRLYFIQYLYCMINFDWSWLCE